MEVANVCNCRRKCRRRLPKCAVCSLTVAGNQDGGKCNCRPKQRGRLPQCVSVVRKEGGGCQSVVAENGGGGCKNNCRRSGHLVRLRRNQLLGAVAECYIVVSSLLHTVWPSDVCDVAVPCRLARPRWNVHFPESLTAFADVVFYGCLLHLYVGVVFQSCSYGGGNMTLARLALLLRSCFGALL